MYSSVRFTVIKHESLQHESQYWESRKTWGTKVSNVEIISQPSA